MFGNSKYANFTKAYKVQLHASLINTRSNSGYKSMMKQVLVSHKKICLDSYLNMDVCYSPHLKMYV